MAMKQNPGRRGGFFSNRNLDSGSMRRILILGGIFGVAAFVILFAKLWQLQVVEHETLEGQAVTQQTREVTSSANREPSTIPTAMCWPSVPTCRT